MKIAATPLENAACWSHFFGRKAKQLHPAQIALADHPAKEKYACWGRRGGKSITFGEVMAPRRALRDPGIVQYIVSLTHGQAKIIFQYAADVVLNSPLEEALDSIKWASPFEMTFKNGSQIFARGLGHDGSTTRGEGADVIYIDEAAFIKHRIVEEVVFPMLTASKYAEVAAISTPNGLNWFRDAWLRGMPGSDDCQSFHMPTWHNPFLNRSHLRAERLRRTRLAWAVEYAAQFVDDQASQFPWDILEPLLDETITLPLLPAPGHRYTFGYDPAETHDRSALVGIDATQRPWPVAYIDDISRQSYVDQKYEVARVASLYGSGEHTAEVLQDVTAHRPLYQELFQLGVSVYEYPFTNASKRELMDGLRLVMEQKDMRLPVHEDLISELKFYRREKSKTGTLKLGAPDDGYDDLATGLALAVHQAKQPRTFSGDDVRAALRDDLTADEDLFAA